MIKKRKRLIKSVACATIAVQTFTLSPISPNSSLSSLFGSQEVQAVTNNDGQIPGTRTISYEFKDEEDLKHKIFSDSKFIRSYASLAHSLGFGWCGGTDTAYVGEGFDVTKDGADYVIKARYNPNEPYASGYRANERLTMRISNIKLYLDTKTLVTDTPKVSNPKPLTAGTFNLDNFNTTGNDTFTTKVIYQTSSSKSHQTNYKFSENLGLKQSFKFTGGLGPLASTEKNSEISLNISAEQGWGDTETKSDTTTLETWYSGSVPAGKRRPVELVALKNEVDVNYKAKIYADYTITFSGFLRYSDNARTDHPTNRPWVDFTFGKKGGKSAIEDIWDQYQHKDIPGYSQWDWKGLSNGKSFNYMLMQVLNRRGGETGGTFHFESATTVNIKALEPIDIPSYHKRMRRSIADPDNIRQSDVSINDIPNVKVLDVSTTSQKGDGIPNIKDNFALIPSLGIKVSASSEEKKYANNEASNVLDKNNATIWTTEWDKNDSSPKSITLNLGKQYDVNKLTYLPRQDGNTNGIITKFNVYVSDDGVNFKKVKDGTWENNSDKKVTEFEPVNATYVKLEAIEGTGGWASASEIEVYGQSR